ncbi:hypothetical protein ACHAWX_005205 [Stephanocyclus meneghinianus]
MVVYNIVRQGLTQRSLESFFFINFVPIEIQFKFADPLLAHPDFYAFL